MEAPSKENERRTRMVSNLELYDTWAKTYDTDGNILQVVDSQEIPSMIAELTSLVNSRGSVASAEPLIALDYGCGTGRNTVVLRNAKCSPPIEVIHAMDPSKGMLELAQKNCIFKGNAAHVSMPELIFHHLPAPEADILPLPLANHAAKILLSTLVLEHVLLASFFDLASRALVPGGYLALTNMHSEMGSRSRAGFLDTQTGSKVQGSSYIYTMDDVVNAGKNQGFELVGKVRERSVDEDDVRDLGARSKKWIGCRVWFGMLLQKQS